MGREANCACQWRDKHSTAKVLLEATEIILRGDIRLVAPRSSIDSFTVDNDDLILTLAGEPLTLSLGAIEAEKWRAYLLKPLPTLAEKLGVHKGAKAFLMGNCDEADLCTALTDATTADPANADMLIAMITSETTISAAITIALQWPDRHIWCVYGKGKHKTIADSVIRAAMRSAGLSDNKTCSISDKLTATRYRAKAST